MTQHNTKTETLEGGQRRGGEELACKYKERKGLTPRSTDLTGDSRPLPRLSPPLRPVPTDQHNR